MKRYRIPLVLAALATTSVAAAGGIVLGSNPVWVADSPNNALMGSNNMRVGIMSASAPASPLHVGQSAELPDTFSGSGHFGAILAGNRAHQASLVAVSGEGIQGYAGYYCGGNPVCLAAWELTLQPLGHDLHVGGRLLTADDVLVNGDVIVDGDVSAGTMDANALSADHANLQTMAVGSVLQRLYVSSSLDASLDPATPTNGGLVVGTAGTNVALDGNEIMARSNGASSSLHINAEGGDVLVHGLASLSKRFRIMDDGRVWIGQGNTVYDDSAKLTVDGSIVAKELLVTTDGWPDYVFEADYDLKSLQEVEAFIAAHGHLPNVPSAASVDGRTVGVGDMQKRLLEKVEELTLHAIAQDKRVAELERACGGAR